jgi:cytochrome c oxidase accessory protein FixG
MAGFIHLQICTSLKNVKKESGTSLDQTFRDSVATIDKTGHRKYVHPKQPSGRLYNIRTIASLVYLAIFFTLPFLKIEGEPVFLFNVLGRKFIFFGQIFGPQDFFIFALGMLTFMVFIILFTVVFGRVFCGWACPQTIFMEMVFRKIEYWIDGDSTKQKQLREMPWNAEKIRKRITKVTVFYLLSFLIANFFMAYLIGMDEVKRYMQEGIGPHFATFATLLVFSAIFFFVYYWFREQVCIVVCPYGRLQGVLLDKDSIVVAYDYVRGEPRGKIKKSAEEIEVKGDCIDCAACVRVCPTGIDIRNGTQLECVNCTACIDACDDIMTSVKRPTGLIRFASENNIAKSIKTKINARIVAYSVVLTVLLSALGFMLASRQDVDITVLRISGSVYQTLQDGRIGNIYNIKMANKTRKDIPVNLTLEGINGEIEIVGQALTVGKEGYKNGTFIIKIDPKEIHHRKTPIKIGVYEGDKKIKTASTTFMGPAN